MPRPRKPTSIVKLTGLDKQNPQRYRRQHRENEPKNTDPIPLEPPDWMTDEQMNAYERVVKECHKDVLTYSDKIIVEMLACNWARFMEDPNSAGDRLMGRIMTGLAHLGMTPASRSKVAAVPRDKDDDNPLQEYAA